MTFLLVAASVARLWTEAPALKERPTAPPASIAALVKISMPAVVGIVATTARGGAESDHFEVGDWVIAIGNPFGLSRSVTTGIVSHKGRRDVNPSGRPGYYDFIQTDAAINPGNSGGPLLDAHGAVIGINAAVNPSGQGIGFAIPVGQLKDVGQQLLSGRVVRGYMGVSIQESMSAELAESFGVPGGTGVIITE